MALSGVTVYTKVILMNIDLFLEMNPKIFYIFSNKIIIKKTTCLKTEFSLTSPNTVYSSDYIQNQV